MVERRRYNKFLALIIIVSLALMIGCAQPPAKEIESAVKAVAEAKQKEADLYVQDLFSKAQTALKKAQDMVGAKNYTDAKNSAVEALGHAQKAIEMVEANKVKMKADAEQIILDVQSSLNDVKNSAVMAVKKKAQINKEEVQGAIGKCEMDLVSAKEQLQAGKIRQAYDQLLAVQEQIKVQKDHITAALEPKTADKK